MVYPYPSLVEMPISCVPSRCALLGALPDLGNGGTMRLLTMDHETVTDSVPVCCRDRSKAEIAPS